jgi:hypothetical protein
MWLVITQIFARKKELLALEKLQNSGKPEFSEVFRLTFLLIVQILA